MHLIDLHCDTISELEKKELKETLEENHLCVNLKGMEQAGTLAQFFACFVDVSEHKEAGWEGAWQEALRLLERLKEEESDNICLIRSFSEIEQNKEKGKISAVATVEEGGVLNGKIERLEELYQKGIRLITLTWNYENCIGYPNSRKEQIMNMGLKAFGRQIVEKMNDLGMIVDVSHLSDGGFWDCIRLSKKPIMASHSNCRTLCAHPRNLTDEMLKALGEKGGIAGLNFYPAFIKEEKCAAMEDIARHAAHMIAVAGEDVPAVGTDFDGFESENIPGYPLWTGDMEKVWDSMKAYGITSRQLDKIWSGNALRLFQEYTRK